MRPGEGLEPTTGALRREGWDQLGADGVCAPALWSAVPAPYPTLRAALLQAERRLNSPAAASVPTAPLWHRLAATAGDPGRVHLAVETVDALLVTGVRGWRYSEHDGRERILLAGAAGLEVAELAALQAVALLLASDDRRRLGQCGHRGCQQVFLDWTNAATRRRCRAHNRTQL